jgi:SAM-dependent methyltransferase
MQLYDDIGKGYADLRRPDPRIAAAIGDALGDARSVVNVGAGTGSYEPRDRDVVAVEPSLTMIGQRPAGAPPCVQGLARNLPFRPAAFDAALAILTVHHWPQRRRSLAELARVARRRVVVLTWDPEFAGEYWLNDEYFPAFRAVDRQAFPTFAELREVLGELEIAPVPVPHDCSDGFAGAYWRRPRAYLDPAVRRAISTFARVPDTADGLRRLERDLDSGAWAARHRDLLERDALDLGYRLVVALR